MHWTLPRIIPTNSLFSQHILSSFFNLNQKIAFDDDIKLNKKGKKKTEEKEKI